MSPRLRNGLIIGGILVILAVTVGPWVYLNVLTDDPPERLGFDDEPAANSGTDDAEADGGSDGEADGEADTETDTPPIGDGIEGAWVVGAGSEAGYRVPEVLFGQDTEAVGRTDDVTGSLTVAGTTIESGTIEVDLTTVESDESRRDGQFQGRIMDTESFPTATFELTEPITFDAEPADLEEITVSATGEFTIRGVTDEITFELTVRRNGDVFEATGAVPIEFSAFEIPDATFGPAQVGNTGEIEFLVIFQRDP